MRAKKASELDWRDGAAYAPLLAADRSLFAWEWLRRDPQYRAAADRALSICKGARCEDPAAAAFGLVGFEAPEFGVPHARPLWRPEVSAEVLVVDRGGTAEADDLFSLDRWSGIATLVAGQCAEHLLLSDGLAAVRIDGPPGLLSSGPACLRYRVDGLARAEARLLALRRFLALCRSGRFMRSLHPPERRARRWILMLRTSDALASGANQREIAEILLSPAAGGPLWRSRKPSLRSQAQRLVRSARTAARDYRELLGSDRSRRPC